VTLLAKPIRKSRQRSPAGLLDRSADWRPARRKQRAEA